MGYKISLLKVLPGHEEYVAHELTKNIKSNTSNSPVCVVKTFGTYDICAIYYSPNFESGPSKSGSIKYILGSNEIFAFHWTKNKNNVLNCMPDKEYVWGLMFLKINGNLAGRYGSSLEKQIAMLVQDSDFGDVSVDVLGTTGWAELLFLIRGKQFRDISEAISSISQIEIKAKRIDFFAAKTFSIIGLNFNLLRNKAMLEKSVTEKFQFQKDVFPVLYVTCSPNHMQKVNEYIKSKMGEVSTMFGENGFSFCAAKWILGEIYSVCYGLPRRIHRNGIFNLY